jgi:hypothetical protein
VSPLRNIFARGGMYIILLVLFLLWSLLHPPLTLTLTRPRLLFALTVGIPIGWTWGGMIAKEQVAALKRQKECDKYCQQVGKWRNVGDSKFISDVIKISFLSVYCIKTDLCPRLRMDRPQERRDRLWSLR